ncbi:nitroreductase family protein [Thermanaerosceptrum fracticalcis]|uniref:Nitroreductase family protein n=1 Tax=Thermanaerosceptrum fracticalcis TaxID=1712410 RepID=A0A7G6E1W2_THEFR|nr:nitroreductase family protein [Thermanaerosceptrum fracticalcis]QNB46066.1 nitroreductase family protein [Thermanaerosceptrum fracticalcis]
MSNIKDVMRERRSIRNYKKDEKISQETLNEILDLATTAPSGWNLQHWKFIVIQEQERKQRLLPIAYNQQHVADCSALVIVLGDTEAYKNAEELYSDANLVKQIQGGYINNEDSRKKGALLNPALAAMQLMLAAKANGIDSCPMTAFDQESLRKELRIPEQYIPVMMITLGYAAEQTAPTGRFPLDRVVIQESF